MNTILNKWGNKFAVLKVHHLWKMPSENRLFKIMKRCFVVVVNDSCFTPFGYRSCNRKFLELTSSAVHFWSTHAVRLLNVSKNRCWKCNAVVIERDLVCMSCGCVLEPRQKLNHFEVFKETPHFDIDVNNLTVKFRRLQTLLHPDKFASRSEKEKEYSAEQSARVNRAYQILVRPMERGLYLLELHGKPLTEEELSPEILADVMEVNEMLEECQTPDALEAIRHVNDAKLQLLFSEVSLSFKEKNFNKARESLCKLKYYVNIDKKIRKMEEDFGISRDD